MQLNEQQQEFVSHIEGSGILHAPVGTGKTLALAERTATAIQRGIKPDKILCLTFTNRATQEMKERITQSCGERANRVRVSTFHSLCAWMLRVEAHRLALPADFTVVDEDDSREILRRIVQERGLRLKIRASSGDIFRELFRRIERCLSDVTAEQLAYLPEANLIAGEYPSEFFTDLPEVDRYVALEYERWLTSEHYVDFPNLILFTRAMLLRNSEIRDYWSRRFTMVQVDEMQDTHMNEYEVLKILTYRSQNIVLAGDYDQTIYEWRGSEPKKIEKRFKKDFPNVRGFTFRTNYRATELLLKTSANVAASYSNNDVPCLGTATKTGRPIIVHFAASSNEEGEWIARQIEKIRRENFYEQNNPLPLHQIAVLSRTNQRRKAISKVFRSRDLPHLTVEQYEFFRRQEVKDALAYLRHLLNPYDSSSLQRILKRLPLGIGEAAFKQVREVYESGLRLADLASVKTLDSGDPFGAIKESLSSGTVTVFDLETTGIELGKDEIVELFALKLHRGQKILTFHRYLKLHDLKTVGDSQRIHGISDDYLNANGIQPSQVLKEFGEFANGSLLVGHNVGFDVKMVNSYARRLGIDLNFSEFADTLEIAKRFVKLERYRLEDLARHFDLDTQPTHRASDDAMTTWKLLQHLIPLVEPGESERRAVIRRLYKKFLPISKKIRSLRYRLHTKRPHEFLTCMLEKSGLLTYYQRNERRLENLRELWRVFKAWDDPSMDELGSLKNLVNMGALARNLDLADKELDRVRILTIHQAKGLEFDVVFLAGLTDGELPNFLAEKQDEERRIFYVGITRAREMLFLTGHAWDSNSNHRRKPSPFFRLIGNNWEEWDSAAISRFFKSQ